jgi:hypothetical protein
VEGHRGPNRAAQQRDGGRAGPCDFASAAILAPTPQFVPTMDTIAVPKPNVTGCRIYSSRAPIA